MEKFALENGMELPVIGFGPDKCGYVPGYHPAPKDIIHRAYNKAVRILKTQPSYIRSIESALAIGFRLIDWSASYGDGSLIAKAIRKSGVKRQDLIITTRVSNQAQFNNTVEEQFFAQLKGFGTDYMDILMFHWPVTGHFEKTWMKMLELQKKGYCRVLGVANCHPHHLEALKEVSGVYPLIDQVEIHPLFTQKALRDYCKKHQIQVESYTPTARQNERLMGLPALNAIASKYNKTKTQVILRWHVQHRLIPVIRSLGKAHQQENMQIFDFSLTEEEMNKIDGFNINSRLRFDPDNCDFSVL